MVESWVIAGLSALVTVVLLPLCAWALIELVGERKRLLVDYKKEVAEWHSEFRGSLRRLDDRVDDEFCELIRKVQDVETRLAVVETRVHPGISGPTK